VLACVDVHYESTRAAAACLLFRRFDDSRGTTRFLAKIDEVQPYEPGAFYRRELPPILRVLSLVDVPIELVIVDSYVWLGKDRPGLGAHLHQALQGRVTVLGVAKTRFSGAPCVEVLRGTSTKPLFVSAQGMTNEEAVARVRAMHGRHRIPTLLGEVDRLARNAIHG